MGSFAFFTIFFLSRRLYAALRYTSLSADWKSKLTTLGWLAIPVYGLSQAFLGEGGTLLAGGVLLAAFTFYAEKEPEFKPFRSVILAHYPLAAMSIISGVHYLFLSIIIDEYHLI